MNYLNRRDAFSFPINKIMYLGSNVSLKVFHATDGVEVLRVARVNKNDLTRHFCLTFILRYLNQLFC